MTAEGMLCQSRGTELYLNHEYASCAQGPCQMQCIKLESVTRCRKHSTRSGSGVHIVTCAVFVCEFGEVIYIVMS